MRVCPLGYGTVPALRETRTETRVMATRAEVHALQAAAMDEAELQRKVEKAARDAGWRVWHPRIAVYSQGGWPDLVCAHPGQGRVIFRELKKQTGKVTDQQAEWLDTLTACGQDAAVWRPIDWVTGAITRELAGRG